MAQDLDVIRQELGRRIAALDARHARPRELAAAVDDIRVLAHQAGFHPAVTVLHFIAAALARGEGAIAVRGWVEVLNDAIRAEHQDLPTCHTFAAACAVRLAA